MKLFKLVLVCLAANILLTPAQAMDSSKDLPFTLIGAGSHEEAFRFRELCFLPQIVMNIKNWTPERIIKAVDDTNFLIFEKLLIKNLERQILELGSELDIKTSKDLAAFLFAHYFINFSIASDVVNTILEHTYKTALNYANHATYLAASDDVWNEAYEDSNAENDATKNSPKVSKADWDNINNAAMDELIKAVKPNISMAINKNKFKSVKYAQYATYGAWKLVTLYVLAYAGQKDFLKTHFKNAYELNKKSLDGTKTFNPSIDTILNIFGNKTWLNANLQSNLYIVSLKSIAQTLALKIN